MKITDLAALVQVRNHILTVINDKSVTNRDEFKPLNEMRTKLDKKFVEVVKTLDVDTIFPQEFLVVKVSGNPTSKDLENLRDVFEASRNDSDFKIFMNDSISIVQLSVDPKSEVKVCPVVESKSIDVSSNISIPQKGLFNFPLETKKDPVNTTLNIPENVINVANEEIKKLESALPEEKNITITLSVPEEKLAPVENARKTKLTESSQDPDIAAAIARQKEELKSQGRSNKKVKKND